MMHQFSKNLKSKNIKQIVIFMIFIVGNFNSIFACSITDHALIDGESVLHDDSNTYKRRLTVSAIPRKDVSTIMISEEPTSDESMLIKDLPFQAACIREIMENQLLYKPEYYDFLIKMISVIGLENDRTQFNLGSFYEVRGNKLYSSMKAQYWYTKSSLQGNMQAQFNLGALYERSENKLYDIEKAKYWYNAASKQGCIEARHRLWALSI